MPADAKSDRHARFVKRSFAQVRGNDLRGRILLNEGEDGDLRRHSGMTPEPEVCSGKLTLAQAKQREDTIKDMQR
jgi:hypothetical protein